MKLKIDKKDCKLKDLKIPKGYRLIEDHEVLKEIRTNKKLKRLCMNGYVWANNWKNETRAVYFDYGSGSFYVNSGIWVGDNYGASRRVLVKK